jgi:hypothetical protein
MSIDARGRRAAQTLRRDAERRGPAPDLGALRRRAHRRAGGRTALAVLAVIVAVTVAWQGLPFQPDRAPAGSKAAWSDPRPHQWVYTKELRVEYGGGKPFTHEFWVRVDGRSSVYQQQDDPRAARVRKVRRERMDWPSRVSAMWPRCPPGKREPLERLRPAVGLGHFFPNPAAVPTDPDGLLAAVYQLVEDPACAPILVGDTVQDRAFMLIDAMLETLLPPEVRAALYRALAKIPEVTVVQGATDAAGRRGVAFARAAAIEGPGSSGWLRLEIILDPDTYRYLGARHVVTRDHFTPDTPTGSKGTQNRTGQVLVSRAQLALAVVDAPCQRPGKTTTCAS